MSGEKLEPIDRARNLVRQMHFDPDRMGSIVGMIAAEIAAAEQEARDTAPARVRMVERKPFTYEDDQPSPTPSSPSEAEELAKRLRREAHFHRNDPFELLNNDLAADLLEEAAALLRKQEEEKRDWERRANRMWDTAQEVGRALHAEIRRWR